MKKSSFLAVVGSLGLLAVAATSVRAQEPSGDSADSTEVMKKWVEFMTPGAEHELLKYKVGKWTAKIEMQTTPDGPSTVSEGTSAAKMIMGGRYLVDEFNGQLQGSPFEGIGTTGYDQLKKRFVSVWIDNVGTGFTISTGTYDEATKTYSYTTMSPDVIVGEYKRTRTVERVLSDDQYVSEMYDTTPDGQEFLMLKGTYTRVK